MAPPPPPPPPTLSLSNQSTTILPLIHLPPLPQIIDPLLLLSAHTHVSYQSTNKDLFEEDEDNFRGDWEKLAMVGDALLKNTLCTLIHRIYPRLAIGVFTHMMSYLLSNQFFSELANAYHITPLARTSPSSYATVIEQVVTGGAMFEAHVGALTYDHQEIGIPLSKRKWIPNPKTATEWLEKLFEPLVRWRYEVEKSNMTLGKAGKIGSRKATEELKEEGGVKQRKITSTSSSTTSLTASSNESTPCPPEEETDALIPPKLLLGSTAWLQGHCSRHGLNLSFIRHDGGGTLHRPCHRVEAYIDGVKRGEALGPTIKAAKSVVSAMIQMELKDF